MSPSSRGPPPTSPSDWRGGQLDCALLPVLDCARMPLARAIPGLGVCTDGPSSGDALFAKVNPDSLRRVAVSPHDSGRVALAQVLLAERFGLTPEYIPVPSAQYGRDDADGVICSGDVLLGEVNLYPHRFDLGAWWQELTGLPFVHFLWIGTVLAPLARLRRVLALALRASQGNRAALVTSAAAEYEMSPEAVEEYLSKAAYHSVGSAEMDGLRVFLELARKHRLCAAEANIAFC